MVGNSLDEQLQLIEKYKQNLEAAKQLRQQVQPVQQPAQHRMIWDDMIVRSLKSKIIQDTNREMEMFRKFREFSKAHPEVTYDEFIKANM